MESLVTELCGHAAITVRMEGGLIGSGDYWVRVGQKLWRGMGLFRWVCVLESLYVSMHMYICLFWIQLLGAGGC